MRVFQIFTPILYITILTIHCASVLHINSQCLENQKNLLLQFKDTIEFNSSFSTKLIHWNQYTDCCSWEGVTCSKAGHVIGLDLSGELLSGGIDDSNSIFRLNFLQSLNLAYNSLNYNTPIPRAFINLNSLTYLNLSNSGFCGQIPTELSQLTRLVTLDLSTFFVGNISLKLENTSLRIFLQNLTGLTELYLDGVKISASGYDWGRAVSSRLPSLRVLSLSNCNLLGPIDSSLANLQFLSVICLDQNNLNSTVPEFIADFKNLTSLSLSSCNLIGPFPQSIFRVQTLKNLDLSNNILLYGSLPNFPENGSIQNLILMITNFSGSLPDSIGNLPKLSKMVLSDGNFSGEIPSSVSNLTQLSYLDLSSNHFMGTVPSFRRSSNLIYIDLSRNNLSGPLSSTHFQGLVNVVHIDLGFNSFTGRIPVSLFGLPSLQNCRLSNNRFNGQLAQIPNASSSVLNSLDLSSNKLEGEIPSSFFDLKMLNVLSLSTNNLNGTLKLENVKKFVNLTTLDLSYNNLSIETSGNSSSSSFSIPQLTTLRLASCKLRNFPDLRKQSNLVMVDLSDNQMEGEIPNWIWKVGSGFLMHLNLSFNMLKILQEPYVFPTSIGILDLHSNRLRGKLPMPPPIAIYVDYSLNYFSSSIPFNIGNNLLLAGFFSVAHNNLNGTIPSSICNASYLQVLDMSNNSLSGMIPICLIEWQESTLGVLNLGQNRLTGNISGRFQQNCGLQTLDLHDNLLEGKIPQSLPNCTSLEVLNLGNNRMLDIFPTFLMNSKNLRVLVLRSNLFYGCIQCSGMKNSWANLQIIDIASNKFSGALTPECFLNWKTMIDAADTMRSKASHIQFEFLNLSNFYYLDTLIVSSKGQQMQLLKILTIFTAIDFSNNNFEGEIPETIGELKLIYVLNLSHNRFTGSIPPSFGNLKNLESLDLSANKITGRIPTELASITFLSFLNLSYNQLSGIIPSGTQLQTFTETSFEGNNGLCGPPLIKSCRTTSDSKYSYAKGGTKWEEFLSGAGFGYAVGLGFLIGPLLFCKRWSEWYWKFVNRVVSLIVNKKYQRSIVRHKKSIRWL